MTQKLASNQDYFHSLSALQNAHYSLLERPYEERQTEDTQAAMVDFIQKGVGTGALLKEGSERRAAQGLLDYWYNELPLEIRRPLDPQLAAFNLTLAPSLDDQPSPYQGLGAFREENSEFFFGREELVQEMLDTLEEKRFLAVIGSSGSGKSSVVMAGLLPQLKSGKVGGSENWRYFPAIIPGSNPLQNLAEMLASEGILEEESVSEHHRRFLEDPDHLVSLLDVPDQPPVVIVVDQFEETFTLCRIKEWRQAFINNLLNLTETSLARHTLILTMRSDFESRLAEVPTLQDIFFRQAVRLTALTEEKLHAIIEKPAEKVKLLFESGLVNSLVQDVVGDYSALPLLQFALVRLWENRERNRVTWDKYRQLCGGGQGKVGLVLSHSADEVYQRLTPQHKITAEDIFLRLVRYDKEFEPTSNRETRRALHKGYDPARVDFVLKTFVENGLLRIGKGKVKEEDQFEVAHEALIRNWQTLVGWLRKDPIDLQKRQRITDAAVEWEARGRDAGALMRGDLLEEARHYQDVLNELEAEFFSVSDEARKAEEEEKRNRIKALERSNRIILVVGALAALMAVLAILFGLNANTNRETSEANFSKAATAQVEEATARQRAVAAEGEAVSALITAESARLEAEDAELQAQARYLNSIAGEVYLTEPLLGMRLALESLKRAELSNDSQILSDIFTSTLGLIGTGQILSLGDNVVTLTHSSDNSQLFIVGREEGDAEAWHTKRDTFLASVNKTVENVTLNTDGSLFILDYSTGPGELRNTNDGSLIAKLSGNISNAFGNGIFLSPATAATETIILDFEEEPAEIWNGATMTRTKQLSDNEIASIRFNPEGTVFFVDYRDPSTPDELRRTGDGESLIPNIDVLNSTFNPDGSLVDVRYSNGSREILRTADGESLAVDIEQVYFSPNSSAFVVDYVDNDLQDEIYTSSEGDRAPTRLEELSSVIFSPDGSTLIIDYSFNDNADEWRDIGGSEIAVFEGKEVTGATFSPSGAFVIVDFAESSTELRWRNDGSVVDTNISNASYNQDESIVFLEYINGPGKLRRTDNNQVLASDLANVYFGPENNSYIVDYRYSFQPDELFPSAGSMMPMTFSNEISDVTFSPDGGSFFVKYDNSNLTGELRRTSDGEVLIEILDSEVSSIHFSSEGANIVVYFEDGSAEVYQIGEANPIASFNAPVIGVIFNSDMIIEGSLPFSNSVSDQVTDPEGDTWTFGGRMGDIVTIVMEGLNSDLRLYDSAGNLLAEMDSHKYSYSFTRSSINNFRLPYTGIYRIGAKGYYYYETGDYTLSVKGISIAVGGEDEGVSTPTTSSFIVRYGDGGAEFWDIVNRTRRQIFDNVAKITYSNDPEKSLLGVEHASGSLELYRTGDGGRLSLSSNIKDILFSPDGYAFVVVYEDGTVQSRKTVEGRVLQELKTTLLINPLNNGTFFGLRSANGPTQLYSSESGTLLADLSGDAYRIECASRENPSICIVFYMDEELPDEVRDAATGEWLSNLNDKITDIAFSSDPNQSVFIVNYVSGINEVRWTADGSLLETRNTNVSGVIFSQESPESVFLINYEDSGTEVRRTDNGRILASLTKPVIGITVSADAESDIFTLHYDDGTLEVYRTSDGKRLVPAESGRIEKVILGAAPVFVVEYENGQKEVLRTADGTPIKGLLPSSTVRNIHFGPDPEGSIFLVEYEAGLRWEVRNIEDGNVLPFQGEVRSLNLSAGAHPVAFSLFYSEGPAEVRSMADASVIASLDGVQSITFSPDEGAAVFFVDYLNAPGELWTIDGERLVTLNEAIDGVLYVDVQDAFIVDYEDPGLNAELRSTVNGELLTSFSNPDVSGYHISSDDVNLVLYYENGDAEIYRTGDANPFASFTGSVSGVFFDTDTVPEGSLPVSNSVSDEITDSEGDSWTFGGQIGDLVTIVMEGMHSRLLLYDSDDNLLTEMNFHMHNNDETTTSSINDFPLPYSGLYRIVARGFYYYETGNYELTVEGIINKTQSDAENTREQNPASAFFVRYEDARAELWNISESENPVRFDQVMDLAFSPNPQRSVLQVTSLSGLIDVWPTDGKDQLADDAKEVIFSPDDDAAYFVTIFSDRPGKIFRTADGDVWDLTKQVAEVDFSPDPQATYLIIKYTDGSSEVWIMQTENPQAIVNLGFNVSSYFFDVVNQRLVVRYQNDIAFVIDLELADSVNSISSEDELLRTACEYISKNGPIAEERLALYLRDDEPIACPTGQN